jgi:hypothetical protein
MNKQVGDMASSIAVAPKRRRNNTDGEGEGEGDSKKKFPWTLHRLLEDAEKNDNVDIISWGPAGISFKVHQREEFMKRILPRYFRQTKFKSFVRQLNLWGFTFIDQGPDKGSCELQVKRRRTISIIISALLTFSLVHTDYHTKFVRGKPHLCHEMRRQKVKGSSQSQASQSHASQSQASQSQASQNQASQSQARSYEQHRPMETARNFRWGDESMASLLAAMTEVPRESVNPFIRRSVPDTLAVPSDFLQANPHRNFLATNQSNTHPNFMPTNERATESGDWLDRLEAMFCPTDLQIPRRQEPWTIPEPTPLRADPKRRSKTSPGKDGEKKQRKI